MRLHNIIVDEKLKSRKNRIGEHKRLNPTAFKGYPGLTHTARPISEYIPKCKIFVEPFAGLGRVGKLVYAEYKVYNDLSDFAVQYLQKHFHAHITQLDYKTCIENWDSKETFYFIDPPWYDEIYDKNPLTELSKTVKEIYKDLEDFLPTIKGNWIIAGRQDGELLKWKYHHKLVRSKDKKLFGKYAKTYLVSNIPFINYHQSSLTLERDCK